MTVDSDLTFLITVAPAPTIHFSPISTKGKTAELIAICDSLPTLTPPAKRHLEIHEHNHQSDYHVQ